MNHQSIESELIMRYTKELKLPTVKDCLEDIVAEASSKGWEYPGSSWQNCCRERFGNIMRTASTSGYGKLVSLK